MLELPGDRVTLRSVLPADAPILRAIAAKPEVLEWWAPEPAPWPLTDDEKRKHLAVVLVDTVIGLVHFAEENNPNFRSASIDIFIDPEYHRQGLGTDALQTVVGYLTQQRAHHRLTIDPALDNERAVRCYEKVGFRRVGVMEAYWRDHATGLWRDGLFMELVQRPLEPE